MSSHEGSRISIPTRIAFGAAGVAAAMLIAGAVVTVSPRAAQATPAFAGQTKLPCGKCHVKPSGGGDLTDFGKAFKANGNALPK
ncbi:MAG: hypothetical protein ABSC25_16240 [Roseiarcus sp.]|jgi:hypothetical protein